MNKNTRKTNGFGSFSAIWGTHFGLHFGITFGTTFGTPLFRIQLKFNQSQKNWIKIKVPWTIHERELTFLLEYQLRTELVLQKSE